MSSLSSPQLTRPMWPYQRNPLSGQARGLSYWLPLDDGGGSRVRVLFTQRPVNPAPSITSAATVTGAGGGPVAESVLRFASGTLSYVSLGNAADLFTNGAAVTISFWYRKRDTTLRNGSILIGSTPALQVALPFADGNSYWRWGGAGITLAVTLPTTWEHWAFTIGTGSMLLYRNGVQIATGTQATWAFSGTITLGNGFAGLTDNIDVADLRFYSRPLSADEVYALYNPATRSELYWSPWMEAATGAVPATPQTNAGGFNVTIGGA